MANVFDYNSRLEPWERAGAVALNHAPDSATQPDKQADRANDNNKFPQQSQNGYYYFGEHGIIILKCAIKTENVKVAKVPTREAGHYYVGNCLQI